MITERKLVEFETDSDDTRIAILSIISTNVWHSTNSNSSSTDQFPKFSLCKWDATAQQKLLMTSVPNQPYAIILKSVWRLWKIEHQMQSLRDNSMLQKFSMIAREIHPNQLKIENSVWKHLNFISTQPNDTMGHSTHFFPPTTKKKRQTWNLKFFDHVSCFANERWPVLLTKKYNLSLSLPRFSSRVVAILVTQNGNNFVETLGWKVAWIWKWKRLLYTKTLLL